MSGWFLDRFSRDSKPGGGLPEAAPARSDRTRGSVVVTVVAVLVLAAAVSLLGWVGYEYVGTNVVAHRAFKQETATLRASWQVRAGSAGHGSTNSTKPTLAPGEVMGLLRIPRFGEGYEVPILAGTDLSVLNRGVGHYDGTAMPGAVGNFAVAGHRITHGEPFAQLLDLRRGDEVIVETRDAIYTYVLDESPRNVTVSATDTWVIDPVPGKPDARPTKRLITLTTGQDPFRSPDRSVGFGHLASTKNK